MSEFAPTQHIETEAPITTPEATIIDFPSTPDESSRYEDVDFAHQAAIQEDVQREMIHEARADVDRALSQNSPLLGKYKDKLTHAEMSMKVNSQESDKFYNRLYRKPSKSAQDEHDLAA